MCAFPKRKINVQFWDFPIITAFRSKNTLLGKNEIERAGLRFWIMSQRWTLWSLQLFLGLRWTKLNRFQILLWRWTWCRRGAIGEFELESTSYVWKRHATVPVYYDSISSWSSSRDSCWMSKKKHEEPRNPTTLCVVTQLRWIDCIEEVSNKIGSSRVSNKAPSRRNSVRN